ncbi:IclR family transcriptional regulator [Pararhizobium haloflavum]|uniref:IclR family transcriptional regulator n=1 Tax=Pararhizobium haloflavum TaxID=2037914 RepID=UPI000C174A49|nr:IclR family transcriptional regulator [Pararhizobium haloflavum]
MADDIPRQAEAQGGIQSLDAALRVLMAMANMEGAVGVSDLARACGMPVSKTHRYLASFIHAGLVCQAGRSGRYDLGPRAIEIGLAALSRHDFVNAASDDLHRLTVETGLTALLCVWGNSGPTVVRWERAASFIATSLGLGTTLPLLTSATGRICLAYLPGAVTGALLDEELARGLASPQIFHDLELNQADVARLAADVRDQGYATVDGRFIPGLVALAAPILDWQGEAQAVVTLIGADPRLIEPGAAQIGSLKEFCASHSIVSVSR